MVDRLLEWLMRAPESLVYLILALLSALENIVPPIPADVVIVFGGFLAGVRGMDVTLLFVVVWLSNIAGAMVVYLLGRRYGVAFMRTRIGRMLLNPRQLQQLGGFYQKHGVIVVFVSRFLPMFRAVVPGFAGIARLGFWRTAIPIALASGLWYGLIIYLGAIAGQNWMHVLAVLQQIGRWLVVLALLLALGIAWWWRSSRIR